MTKKRLLCFGDSNTWGSSPQVLPNGSKRWPAAARWTTLLAGLLGQDWQLEVDGLSGRTTDLDDPDEGGGKSGAQALAARLDLDGLYDLAVVMLGTNDLKSKFRRNASEIGAAMGCVLRVAQRRGQQNILLIAPPPLSDVPAAAIGQTASVSLSQELAAQYEALAKNMNVSFLDAAACVPSMGSDGWHLEREAHTKLAHAIYAKLRKTVSNS